MIFCSMSTQSRSFFPKTTVNSRFFCEKTTQWLLQTLGALTGMRHHATLHVAICWRPSSPTAYRFHFRPAGRTNWKTGSRQDFIIMFDPPLISPMHKGSHKQPQQIMKTLVPALTLVPLLSTCLLLGTSGATQSRKRKLGTPWRSQWSQPVLGKFGHSGANMDHVSLPTPGSVKHHGVCKGTNGMEENWLGSSLFKKNGWDSVVLLQCYLNHGLVLLNLGKKNALVKSCEIGSPQVSKSD